ncbi:MAG: hypothetical protein ACREU7_09105, partial [Burkholderiales bacterium]
MNRPKRAAGSPAAIRAPHDFLPDKDPLVRLPPEFKAWDRLASDLPKLLTTTRIRSELAVLPKFPLAQLKTEPQLERAMMVLSYLGHAYVWGEAVPAAQLPAALAVPWHAVAKKVGRPPVLSYPSYALYNWKRMDPRRPIALGNIVLLQNFLAGIDEEWFILIHVDIEAKAGSAIAALKPAQQAALDGDAGALLEQLQIVSTALSAMYDTLSRMPENCDPYIYYNRVRPYIHGWKNNPALPKGLVYEGVKEYGGKPQKFAGETGAQSSIVPSLDAVLG